MQFVPYCREPKQSDHEPVPISGIEEEVLPYVLPVWQTRLL